MQTKKGFIFNKKTAHNVCCMHVGPTCMEQYRVDSGGIRTHASEKTGALNQRLRPLGHAILS